ncbi:hypothetical protein CC1G_04541 [Coprinopsis cinerea okayama7|uniref:CBM1 domain-containing protein n=1 Tax=Coprinopsis cinerea (strain Okayama-7 / 130 / ATCC MYA-4618 / FGSC 9003) TaxID=240176 RepID=A8N5G3_COPC7|nr:hypothetical protein CC1G_04541 [Coprinopsis cinerea okayama7\|eukprot:XP_001830108.2 hypothetical protein CC1G_04541 [Coprinopsis cinerea okayama7\
MFLLIAPIFLCLTIPLVSAQSEAPAWGQCGGQGWSGPTQCVSGYTCNLVNEWYSQCVPGSAPPVTNPPVVVPPTTTVVQPPSTTIIGPPPSGSQIRTVTNPVYHFYLQNNGGVPRLGPESSSGRFIINGTITLNQADGTRLYLNADDIGASYKPLSFGTTATTTNWGLEGDTIIIRNPRQLNFLACSTNDRNFYDVFLQGQGNASPPGRSCNMVTMHLPCLC